MLIARACIVAMCVNTNAVNGLAVFLQYLLLFFMMRKFVIKSNLDKSEVWPNTFTIYIHANFKK